MNHILVVVDMQNDFINGSLANQSAEQIIPRIEAEIKSGKYSHIIFTRDTHSDNYLSTQEGKLLPIIHCIKDTKGWEVCDELLEAASKTELPITFVDKPTFGYMYWHNSLYSIVDENTEITFVGTCTDICVVSNALAVKATFPENKVNCIPFCCAPLFGSNEKQASAVSVMKSCQINVL